MVHKNVWKFENIWLSGTLIIIRKPEVWRTDGRTDGHEDPYIPPTLVKPGDKKYVICERQWALYGIKCVRMIFDKHGCTYWWIKKNSAHCNRVPCNTLTHSTNEDLLSIKRKGDPKSLTLSHTSDTTETRKPCVIKVILLACFTYMGRSPNYGRNSNILIADPNH